MWQFFPLIASGVANTAGFLGTRKAGRDAAEDIVAQGEFDAERARRNLSGILGAQRSQFGAQGLDVSFGDAAAITEQTLEIGEADINQIRENAMRQAMGIRSQANTSSFGYLGNALSAVTSLGANAWESYRNGRNPNSLAPATYNASYGPAAP